MKKMKLRGKITQILVGILVVSVSLNAVWSKYTYEAQAEKELLEKAQILTSEMEAVWKYMDVNQERIDTNPDGSYSFKGVYCAIAGKSIAKILEYDTDYIIRYVNTKPRQETSLADDFEANALEAFGQGRGNQYYGLSTYGESEVFRYASPIYIKESCLSCHGSPAGELDVTNYPKEGMEVGDLIGVTSIIMPIELYMNVVNENIARQIIYSALVMGVVAIIVYLAITRMIIRPLAQVEDAVKQIEGGNFDISLDSVGSNGEIKNLAVKFNEMAIQLKDSYQNLESQVESRTAQLASVNELLENQREELARINEELHKENRYQSDFFASMSHALRTPLTAIIAYTDIWERSQSRNDEAEIATIQEIKGNGQLLLQLVDNILEMARAEAGKNDHLHLEAFDMVDLVGIVESTVSFLAKRKGVELATFVHPDVPIVWADWEKVRRIIENLVSNAIKFTHKGGRVMIEVSYLDDQGELQIVVSDTGIGIKERDVHKIFEKFTQKDNSSYRRYRGSGLGLAVVKELLENQQGSIEVESTYKQGSRFKVRIPTQIERGDHG